jgi:F-type H+-transporting ATPase subunit delta
MTSTTTYASVLFEVAKSQGALDVVEDELFRVARTLEGNDDLRWMLSDPSTPLEVRQGALADLLAGRVAPVTSSLVGWLVGEGQAKELVDTLDAVVALVAAERNESVAEVRVAAPLDEERIAALRSGISRTVGRDVTVKVVVDPSVIGGVLATVGDTVIDGTIGHRLEQMRRAVRRPMAGA